MSVVKDSVGSTYNYGDFTNDNAFFWSSLDLSPCAGALGRTLHKAILLDANGKEATGYLAGEDFWLSRQKKSLTIFFLRRIHPK